MNEQFTKLLDKPTISIEDAARILGLGRNSAYKAAKNGDIPTLRIGGRYLVRTTDLRRMLGIAVDEVKAQPVPLDDDLGICHVRITR